MEFEDYKKLAIDSEMYFSGKKVKILSICSGEKVQIQFWFDFSLYYWADICQDCSLTPPVEKKKIKLFAFISKDTVNPEHQAGIFYKSIKLDEWDSIRLPQFDFEIEI